MIEPFRVCVCSVGLPHVSLLSSGAKLVDVDGMCVVVEGSRRMRMKCYELRARSGEGPVPKNEKRPDQYKP